MTNSQGAQDEHDNDYGEYVGAYCKVKYHGKHVGGRVKAVFGGKKRKRWVIQFEDGFVVRCGEKTLAKMLVVRKRKQIGKQLDYIMVSSRWKSCVRSCAPKWGPSMHRNIHGQKGDHALLACTWQWRMRTEKKATDQGFLLLHRQAGRTRCTVVVVVVVVVGAVVMVLLAVAADQITINPVQNGTVNLKCCQAVPDKQWRLYQIWRRREKFSAQSYASCCGYF